MPPSRHSRRDPEQIAFAREQRKDANDFAQHVWQMVRSGRILGEKFRREHPIGPYTLDFVCLELKLNIEIDGKEHLTAEGRQHDQLRDAYLQRLGFTVLRVPGFRVTQDPISVCKELKAMVEKLRAATLTSKVPSPPTHLPSPRFGKRGRG